MGRDGPGWGQDGPRRGQGGSKIDPGLNRIEQEEIRRRHLHERPGPAQYDWTERLEQNTRLIEQRRRFQQGGRTPSPMRDAAHEEGTLRIPLPRQALDDTTGEHLPAELVAQARELEMKFMKDLDVYEYDTFMLDNGPMFGGSIYYAPFWWMDFGVYGGVIIGKSKGSLGWEQQNLGEEIGEHECSSRLCTQI